MQLTLKEKNKKISVMGLFKSRAATERAYDELRDVGFRKSDIVAFLDDNHTDKTFKHVRHSRAAEGAAIGFFSGTFAGAVLGYLTESGFLGNAFEETGPFISVVIGIAIGSNLGAILGGLVGYYFPIFVAKRYSAYTNDAGILMSVHCDSKIWIHKARLLLKKFGATDITSKTESRV
jgi:hypothetical protein